MAGQRRPKVGLSAARSTAQQSRNRRQEGLTAEYAEYAENRLPPGSPLAYSAYSAVYLFPEDSSQPANNFHFCSAVQSRKLRASADQRSAAHLNRPAAEMPQESGLDKLG